MLPAPLNAQHPSPRGFRDRDGDRALITLRYLFISNQKILSYGFCGNWGKTPAARQYRLKTHDDSLVSPFPFGISCIFLKSVWVWFWIWQRTRIDPTRWHSCSVLTPTSETNVHTDLYAVTATFALSHSYSVLITCVFPSGQRILKLDCASVAR